MSTNNITSAEDLIIDYEYLENYIKEKIFRESFYNSFERNTIDKKRYEQFVDLLRRYNIANDHNLHFFWIHFSDMFYQYKIANDLDFHKAGITYNKELKQLKQILDKVVWHDGIHESRTKMLAFEEFSILESITIKRSLIKTPQISVAPFKIKSEKLLRQIFMALNEITEKSIEYPIQTVKNKKGIFQNYILRTRLLFDYLEEKHFVNTSAYKIYSFIVEFVICCGYEWNTDNTSPPEDYIKNTYLNK